MQLAIDTSTDTASLALVQESRILSEFTWHCGQNHTVELFPRLEFMLFKTGFKIEDLDCIFVARGPGSFNGLRVGVSAAKGLAFTLGLPIIGVSTLEATAYQHAESGLAVCAVQNAGREEIAAALYQKKPRKGWSQIAAEHLTTVPALISEIKGKTIFCGEFNAATAAQIKKLFKSEALLPTPAGNLRRAAYIAELGEIRRQRGEFDNLGAFQPTYLRKPPITERKKA